MTTAVAASAAVARRYRRSDVERATVRETFEASVHRHLRSTWLNLDPGQEHAESAFTPGGDERDRDAFIAAVMATEDA
jgi:hypothetical protein